MNNSTIKLVILGEPKSQKRPKFQHKDKDGNALPYVHTYDPSSPDKFSIRLIVQQQAPEQPLRGPIRVDCYFYYGYLKGHYGSGRNADKLKESAPLWKDTGKDRDNCDKLILDALTGIFFVNDSQICDGRIIKQYSEKPRTEIYITPLNQNRAGL